MRRVRRYESYGAQLGVSYATYRIWVPFGFPNFVVSLTSAVGSYSSWQSAAPRTRFCRGILKRQCADGAKGRQARLWFCDAQIRSLFLADTTTRQAPYEVPVP